MCLFLKTISLYRVGKRCVHSVGNTELVGNLLRRRFLFSERSIKCDIFCTQIKYYLCCLLYVSNAGVLIHVRIPPQHNADLKSNAIILNLFDHGSLEHCFLWCSHDPELSLGHNYRFRCISLVALLKRKSCFGRIECEK